MTEVAGEGALLIDPEKEAEAAQTIADAMDRFGELREAGFRNVKRMAEDVIMAEYERFLLAAQDEPQDKRPKP
jgi:hypothetical protein